MQNRSEKAEKPIGLLLFSPFWKLLLRRTGTIPRRAEYPVTVTGRYQTLPADNGGRFNVRRLRVLDITTGGREYRRWV